jgi:hypothetical protein
VLAVEVMEKLLAVKGTPLREPVASLPEKE